MILVVGSTNTDMVVKSDKFPQPGETILGGEFFMFPGGKGANQAVAAARLGGKVVFVTKVGTDLFGDQALVGLAKEGINTSYVLHDAEHPSGVALISVNSTGENQITVAPGANNHLSVADLPTTEVDQAQIVLTQLETPTVIIEQLSKTCPEKLILNPAPAATLAPEVFKNLFLITPNQTEAHLLTGISADDQDGAEKAADKLLDMGVQNVLITMGKSGSYFKNDKESFFQSANAVQAVDTTAAGDVFNGALAVGLSENMDWRSAIAFANAAAGISVTRMGAQSSAPYRHELPQ